jgi:hypothetical protein
MRGSMAAATMRLLTRSQEATWAALAKAFATASLVAALEAEGQVARRFRPDLRGPRVQRAAQLGHRGQDVVIDHDLLAGVARCLAAPGDDEGDEVADMAHPVARQRKTRRHDQRIDGLDHDVAGQGVKPIEIVGSVDAPHAGHLAAAAVSIERMRAWAWGERTMAAKSSPGTGGRRDNGPRR